MNTSLKPKAPKITARMKLFVDHSLANLDFWDFCCDHGYTGIYALQLEKFSCIHFVDQQKHIIENLKLRFQHSQSFIKKHYQFQFYAEDARQFQYEVTGNLLIAGVGGKLAYEILKHLSAENLLKAKRILLSVHSEEEKYLKRIQELLTHYSPSLTHSFTEGNRQRKLELFDLNSEDKSSSQK